MMSQRIRMLEYNSIQYFLIRSCFVGVAVNNVLHLARQDSWISYLIAFAVGFLPLLIYLYIINKYPNHSIFDISVHIFGKVVGEIINVIFFLFFAGYCILKLWNLSSFVGSQYLYRTPTYFITIMFLIVILYALNKGLRVIARTCLILFYLSIFLYVFSAVGLFGQIHYDNVLPIFEHGIGPVLKGVNQAVSYNVLPLFLLMIVPKERVADKKHFNRNVIIFYMVTMLMLFIIIFTVQNVFGIHFALLYQYPEYHILKMVTVVGFIERVEVVLSFQWVLDMLLALIFAFYLVTEYIYRLFKIQNKKVQSGITFLVCFVSFIASLYVLQSNTQGNELYLHYMPPIRYIVLLGIPIMMVVISKFKKNQDNNSGI